MWEALPINEKEEYKRIILAFASLSEMFAQKIEDGDTSGLVPIINSKFQETLFQRAFSAKAEDVGNTSYDASLEKQVGNVMKKYLVGIKTFGIGSGYQNIAQFKAEVGNWSQIFAEIEKNCEEQNLKTKEEINKVNEPLYRKAALKIAEIRNMRIDSSEANAKGFNVEDDRENLETVYHVLMPSKKDEPPCIYVGETSYNRININAIKIIGCTSKKVVNFEFEDGIHRYRFTFADSQLLMDFKNRDIVKDSWDVKYLDDPYAVFAQIADNLDGGKSNKPVSFIHQLSADNLRSKSIFRETYSWKIVNKYGEVERYSGFNAFYGVSSKMSRNNREQAVENLKNDFSDDIPAAELNLIYNGLREYFNLPNAERMRKELLRDNMMKAVKAIDNNDFTARFVKLAFRPVDELYIPLPNSLKFHTEHPDFFAPGAGRFERKNGKWEYVLPKEERAFNMVFEPSGNEIRCFITQDTGKGIESDKSQGHLGNWLLRKVFQLNKYEPLTAKRLDELGINGVRLAKNSDTGNIHFTFLWIDDDNLPDDYIGYKQLS